MKSKQIPIFVAIFLWSSILSLPLVAQETLTCRIDKSLIVTGCISGRDCIPALTNPKSIDWWDAVETQALKMSDLVLGVYINGVARAYQHRILWWHEVVNDTVGGEMVTISFCPLTTTALLFDGTLEGEERTFGVSGLLYNNNLIIYDRLSGETLFPQMCYVGLNGNLQDKQLKLLPMMEATLGAWTKLHPDTKVLSNDTGFSRPYGTYPYGDYRTNDDFLLFPITKEDPRLPRKDMILGLNLNNTQRAYPFKAMGARAVLNDDVGGTKVLVLFSDEAKFAAAYYRTVDGQELIFEESDSQGFGTFLVKDKETGSVWDLEGNAISGPLASKGTKLEQIPAYNAFWFAWGTFWDNPEIADIEAIITSVDTNPNSDPPQEFALLQNFPNPFNPNTRIAYDLPENTVVTLKIYNLLGKEVRTLVNKESQPAGRQTVLWDGRNNSGQLVSSGMFIYRIEAGSISQTRKMVMLK
jgi:hypothetical protein